MMESWQQIKAIAQKEGIIEIFYERESRGPEILRDDKLVDPLTPLVVLHEVGRRRIVCYFSQLWERSRS